VCGGGSVCVVREATVEDIGEVGHPSNNRVRWEGGPVWQASVCGGCRMLGLTSQPTSRFGCIGAVQAGCSGTGGPVW
jgi:hypothetical protein